MAGKLTAPQSTVTVWPSSAVLVPLMVTPSAFSLTSTVSSVATGSMSTVGALVSTAALRVTVAVLPATSLLVTVKVTVPLSGRLSLGTVALQAPAPLAVAVTAAPVPVAMLTLRLASVMPERVTPAARSAPLINPSPAMVALVWVICRSEAKMSST